MALNDFSFLILFVLLLVLFFVFELLKKTVNTNTVNRMQLVCLLASSYYFVYCADWRFCLCVAAETVIAYVCARLVERAEDARKKRAHAVWGGALLLGFLGYFKYTNFFVGNAAKLLGVEYSGLAIILPLGISFFTFSALSYIFDVLRGKCGAEKSLLDFALYMAFFPKIMAGPIVRWTDFKPQIEKYRGLKLGAFHDGIQIFVFGLFKKIVLADHLGVFVDDVFFAPAAYDTGTVILATFSYSLQIYFDFSGYSDMAAGIAKVFGFDFKANFNLPYTAAGFSDFWRRWHISLSEWFRDYLYFPLGGSRKGEKRAYLNLLAVMLVSGIWHGAGWTFLLWGLLHGIASCLERLVKRKGIQIHAALETVVTFVFVTLFWTVFRAESMENMLRLWESMLSIHGGISQPYAWSFFAAACLTAATLFAGKRSRENGKGRVEGYYPVLDLSKIGPMVLFFTFCGLTVILGYFGNTAFIYGRF